MYVPFLGRLSVIEWFLLLVSFWLSWMEYVSNIITKLLPTPVLTLISSTLRLMYKLMGQKINFTTKKLAILNDQDVPYKYVLAADGVDDNRYKLMTGLLNSRNIQDMCLLFGYAVENRIVKTNDGYLLTIQRLTGRKDEAGNFRQLPRNGKVVYMHHGLLMCSEIWVTMLDRENNLPFVLYDLGYDVWFGNNRGNKYSQKHMTRPLNSEAFWNFSIDEFALFDIPDSINFILEETGKQHLTYIGFSQGTAQAFASVSVNPELTKKIDKIIAISPATTPHGLYSKFLDILLKSSPKMLFLLFSRKALLPSVVFWGRIMYPPFFNTSIDLSNYLLFYWKAENIDKIQKLCSYAHLYSTTSVKTVVHWFQIMQLKNFQMYHDATSGMNSLNPISYPLSNISIPIHLIYGDSDSLVDIDVMKSQLPAETTHTHKIANHEHLDNLWGRDVSETVFPLVLAALGETPNGTIAKLAGLKKTVNA
ncbi:alpha/beta-hydrolase [Metschnikowia bicuspidata var. bicuspidata NRRL YB-4993]|uniref:Alpha/beta-hydrolase n=1 Tax=Metschnikowia bicuspidata var. bicuspidata NRRL YB-4993 TaxID=869754 RepID=A0A1A0HA78_9ASCO|nr:alpha/beta-hydrolase [Metschnikowia bicuspidata var. bicuspidata NRRL YB-4993]OBA21034.1 alpha/beta-hydrolase [Metschnikowia bicuspidata var. bicuspidata NRRL YB-4993]